MKFPSKGKVEQYRKKYPIGCRVELISMDDFLSRIIDNGSYQDF